MVKLCGSNLIPLGLAFGLCLVEPELSLGFVFPHCWGRNFLVPNLSLMNHEVFHSGWWEWPLSWLWMNPGIACSYPVRRFILWPRVDFPTRMHHQLWAGILQGTHYGSQVSLCAIFSSPVLYDENSGHAGLPGLSQLYLLRPGGGPSSPCLCVTAWKLSADSKLGSPRDPLVCFPSLRDRRPSLLISSHPGSYCFTYLPRLLFLANLVPDTPSWSEAEVTRCF